MKRLAPLGVALALIGYWGPWVNHKTAALVLSGLDMAEFVKFLPGVRAGTEFMIRELFYLPPLAAAFCLALIGSNRLWRYPLWARAIMVIVALVLAIIVLPPYPFVLQALSSDEFRRQFLMAAGCLVTIGASLLYRRLSKAVVAGLLIVVSLAGAIPPWWQFLSIRSALDSVYGQPIHIGWGLWLTVAGFLVVAGAGGWRLEIGGWRLEVREWRLEVRRRKGRRPPDYPTTRPTGLTVASYRDKIGAKRESHVDKRELKGRSDNGQRN